MIDALKSSACWPSRFFAKWLAAFLGATVLGAAVAAFTHKSPPVQPPPSVENVSVEVRVVVTYPDLPEGESVGAMIYVSENGHALGTGFPAPYPKSFAAGSKLHFVIKPKDGGTGGEQDVVWPKGQEGSPLILKVVRTTPHGSPISNSGVSGRNDHPATSGNLHTNQTPPTAQNGPHYARPRWIDNPLLEADTQGKNPDQIQDMINELYAASGYKFAKPALNTKYEMLGYRLENDHVDLVGVRKKNEERLLSLKNGAEGLR